MRKEELFEAIGGIDDTLVAKSDKKIKRKKNLMFRSVLAAAACFALLLGAAVAMNQTGLLKPLEQGTEQGGSDGHGIPGNPGDEVGIGADEPDIPYNGPSIMDGGEGEEIEVEYMRGRIPGDEFVEFNPGPLMPVTLAQANSFVSAKRDMTYDFSAVTKEADGFVEIKDSYEFANTSDTDQKVTLLYPYLGTILDMNNGSKPEVSVDGESVGADMMTGAYYGNDGFGYEHLLSFAHTTEEMSSIIGDVAAHAGASAVDEELWNKKVLVYEFSDVKCEGDPTEYGAYAVKFKADDYKNIYFQDIGGVTYYEGYLYVGFYVEDVLGGDEPRIIFMDGKEPEAYSEQGYSCMEFFEQYEVDDISASMSKKEITFGEVFDEVIKSKRAADYWGENRTLNEQEQKLFEGFAAQIVSDVVRRNEQGGEMSDMSAYFSNSISDMAYYAYTGTTLFLVKNEITIPAGGSVKVVYTYNKQGQHDETCPEPDFLDCYGYDNAINMGTNLTFTQQIANISQQDNIEIIEQNYGFDLEVGVTSVELNPDVEKYYMTVRILQ